MIEAKRGAAAAPGTAADTAGRPAGPLSGYRVIELCSTIAGPVCARLMADFGAEVIKVEPPEGDAARNMGLQDQGESLYCASMLRNKQAVCIDLKTDEGRELVRRLAAGADFVIENFRPGTLERLGLGYDALSADNPGLILVRISGYGQDGPYSQLPGYGAICEAIAGVRHLTGDPDRPPARVALATTDYLTAVYAAFGAMLALEHRHRTGRGQVVDTALYETAFSMMESYVPAYPRLGTVPQRQGPRLMNTAPNSLYPTRDDSYVLIAANNDAIFRRLAKAMGHPEWADDERYATQLARGKRVDEVDAMVEQWTRAHDAAEIVALMNDSGVPVAKVYTIADIFADPHFAARGMLAKVPHPRLGEVVLPGVVPRLSETPGEIREPGHLLGADTDAVLSKTLGLTDERIAALRAAGVVR
ncbi:CoA transferase [Burkholderiaceae bacterium FT117]|uniref:CaiB/BaiF CoA transferase family protein n=1 Tax=Zeimonas sediminis TaxID=2944268 RepID=UPI002342E03B|nr:CaiB/BaiF CoA-transferase family protein [Zeimonas sediminis]MCM5569935.1 CoA transferase [Zeimonas sediminis]